MKRKKVAFLITRIIAIAFFGLIDLGLILLCFDTVSEKTNHGIPDYVYRSINRYLNGDEFSDVYSDLVLYDISREQLPGAWQAVDAYRLYTDYYAAGNCAYYSEGEEQASYAAKADAYREELLSIIPDEEDVSASGAIKRLQNLVLEEEDYYR